MSRRCRFIIDTDGGADDAIAIMMALRHPDVQVEAITTVAGNVGVEQATRNALYLVELCERLLGMSSIGLPDAIAVAVAIDASICRTEALYVTVETSSELTRGETVVDRWGVLGQSPNVEVCFDPDAAKFKHMLFDTLT